MIAPLEILEFARVGLRSSINSKKRLLNECGYSGRSAEDVKSELAELQSKYKELERMLIAEKERMH